MVECGSVIPPPSLSSDLIYLGFTWFNNYSHQLMLLSQLLLEIEVVWIITSKEHYAKFV